MPKRDVQEATETEEALVEDEEQTSFEIAPPEESTDHHIDDAKASPKRKLGDTDADVVQKTTKKTKTKGKAHLFPPSLLELPMSPQMSAEDSRCTA